MFSVFTVSGPIGPLVVLVGTKAASYNRGDALRMSSREIAKLTGSRHDKVKQSIERLAAKGVITFPPMGETSFTGADGRIQKVSVYNLEKRDSIIVVAQLCPEFTATIVGCNLTPPIGGSQSSARTPRGMLDLPVHQGAFAIKS